MLVGCRQLSENRAMAISAGGRAMVDRKHTTAVLFACFVAGTLPAQAATHEEVVESCRQSVGRPIVQACMGGRRDMLEECRKKATPAVRACVIKEEQRIAATNRASHTEGQRRGSCAQR